MMKRLPSKTQLFLMVICLACLSGCSGSSGSSGSDNSGTRVINEIGAKDADGGNDWVELYVTEGTIALGEYHYASITYRDTTLDDVASRTNLR